MSPSARLAGTSSSLRSLCSHWDGQREVPARGGGRRERSQKVAVPCRESLLSRSDLRLGLLTRHPGNDQGPRQRPKVVWAVYGLIMDIEPNGAVALHQSLHLRCGRGRAKKPVQFNPKVVGTDRHFLQSLFQRLRRSLPMPAPGECLQGGLPGRPVAVGVGQRPHPRLPAGESANIMMRPTTVPSANTS
jgi:hypothetical protein